jgi:DNA polymerase III sliding clamp (beta) subunit (PCNA family)
VYAHLLFTGEQVLAYNDRIAISAPLKTNYKGTALGREFLEYLRMGPQVEKVELKSDNNSTVTLVADESRATVEARAVTEYPFHIPTMPKVAENVDAAFFQAVEDCLFSVNEKGPNPIQWGITLIPSGKDVKMFATDATSLSYCKTPIPANSGLKSRSIITFSFCREMLRLGKAAEKCKIAFRDDHVMFSADNILLFGHYVNCDHELKFEKVLTDTTANRKPVVLNGDKRPRVKIAFDMAKHCLKDEKARSNIKIKSNVMEILSVSGHGRHFDRIEIKHPNVETNVAVSYLTKVYDRYETIHIGETSTIMTRGNNDGIFVVAAGA